MGNKQGRPKSTSELDNVKRRKKGKGENANGKADKHISCPDIGAIPYKQHAEEPGVEIRMYRSYRDLKSKSFGPNYDPTGQKQYDIKYYKRSSSKLDKLDESPSRTQTLPRNFGRSRSAHVGLGRYSTQGNGYILDYNDGRDTPDTLDNLDSPGMRKGNRSKMSSYGSLNNSNSRLAPVSATDFPNTQEVIQKLRCFEDNFAHSLVAQYRELTEESQLSSLSIALRKRFGDTKIISLLEYMEGDTVPSDLLAHYDNARYVLTIPHALFHGVQHVRKVKLNDIKLWTSLAADIVLCIGIEAGNELSRMFEYQIALMYDLYSVKVLAEHAAECVVEYVKNNTYLDRNTAIQGVIHGHPISPGLPKYMAVVVGDRELKWDLYDIYKRPAMRKELALTSAALYIDPDEHSECVQPWTHLTPAYGCDPILYGYRGQLIIWNFEQGMYEVDPEDGARYSEEVIYRPDDFHRLYMPYKRLVGYDVMKLYCDQLDNDKQNKSLAEFIKCEIDQPERDVVQPVYRPVASASALQSDNMILDDVDLVRAKLGSNNLGTSRAQNAKLLLADVNNKTIEDMDIRGADLSYSTMDGAQVSHHKLQGHDVKVKHVLLSRSESTGQGDVFTEEDDIDVGNKNIICDHDGKVLPVDKAIEERQQRIVEEEKNKPVTAGQPAITRDSRGSSRGSTSPATPDDPNKDIIRPHKKKRKPKQKPQHQQLNNQQRPIDTSTPEVATRASQQQASRPPIYPENRVIRPERGPPPQQPPPQQEEEPSQRAQRSHSDVTQYNREPRLRRSRSGDTSAAQVNGVNGVDDRAHRRPKSNAHSSLNNSFDAGEPGLSATNAGETSLDNQVIIRGAANQEKSKSATNIHRNAGKHSSLPRMAKSTSHHGYGSKSLSTDTFGLGCVSGLSRRQLSRTEVEYIRKSQIFTMMRGLVIEDMAAKIPKLPDKLVGREEEITDIAELLQTSGRVMSMTGCYGIGKSSLAIAVAHELRKKQITPFYIDVSGCQTTDGVLHRTCQVFDVNFSLDELPNFYNWLNSHEQKLMFLYDNLDVMPTEDEKLSTFIDNLMFNVRNLRIVCTGRRACFAGKANSDIYRVGDVRKHSVDILRQAVPDLHEDGFEQLADAAGHVLYALQLCGASFSIQDVDTGALFEDLTSINDSTLSETLLADVLSCISNDKSEKSRLACVARCVHNVLEQFSGEVTQLLASVTETASFNVKCASSLSGLDKQITEKYCNELCKIGLLSRCNDSHTRYMVPKIVKMVVEICWYDDRDKYLGDYVNYFVDLLSTTGKKFHTKKFADAIQVMRDEYDNILDVANRILAENNAYDLCLNFATREFAMFLYEFLPSSLYDDLYDTLANQCDEKGDTRGHAMAMCCLSYKCDREGEYGSGKELAERAYAVLHIESKVRDLDKAFCVLCLGKMYWRDTQEKERGLGLVKRAVDMYKAACGLRNNNTLHAHEDYGIMLTEKESYQSARHFFNVTDIVVHELPNGHPLLLEGYSCRRQIWDKLGLFGRATEVAQKAVNAATNYYGDHPKTATTLMNLCECIMKRGSLNDAIETCVRSLSMRIMVLGNQVDTGLAYKTLGYLMLRSGQYDEAVRFAESALEIYDAIDAKERYILDAKNIIAQSRVRLDFKSSVFVEIESTSGSKTNNADVAAVNGINGGYSSSHSTEV